MYTLGIDIGSTTSKCVLMKDGNEIIAKSLRVGGLGTKGPDTAVNDIWEDENVVALKITRDDIAKSIVTGYGRRNYSGGDGEVSELTCHALGARFVFKELRTVIDIGGQDAKIIRLSEDGRMTNFVMNDKCAAGTGRFLDVMANILTVPVDDFGKMAEESTEASPISSTCTVFAESEVISQLANGAKMPDLIKGICSSVASRVAGLARRVGVQEVVCMSGGVAKNEAVRKALEKELKVNIAFDPLSQHFGSIGAALWGYQETVKKIG